MKEEKNSMVLEALVQAIPYVGGSLATIYFGRKQEKRFQRLERFYQELKDEIEIIGEQLPAISLHNFDELTAILEELHEKVETEHLEIKRKYYKEYFKNTLKQPVNGNFEERKLFLDILADLSPLQIELVIFLSKQSQPISIKNIRKPGIEQSLIIGSINRLKSYGIVETMLDSIVFGSVGNAINENVKISNFGLRFHLFCIDD